MAATSPYSQNDYQASNNFRPYELPINDIFKAISAQNQFWDAGAARIKSVYDNALNLKLSLEPNKEIRKKYLEDAEKQLTKLSAMDVSDPSVQRQGFALFKPLFQDEGIIYDDLTTRHYEKVRNDALTYRSKDNGKGYSDINFQYAMQGYNEFMNSKDRMVGKQFYDNRKEYTPYYDYTEDFSKSLKDCHPSSIETTSPNYGSSGAMTGYLKETSSKGLSAAQVRGCLEAGLSPNAKRQLQIEGTVGYKNNLPVLASDTSQYLSGVAGNLSIQLQQLAATKAGISSRKDLSQTQKDQLIQAIDNQIDGVTQELDKTNHEVSKINAGDYTEIQNNFETYAGSVYSYKKLYKKALASAFEERRENYKADPVQLNAIRFQQEKTLRQIDFQFDVSLETMKEQHDREMKLLDLMYGGSGKGSKGSANAWTPDVYRDPLTGQISVNPFIPRETPNLNEAPEINEKIYEEITGQVSALNEQDQNNNLRLYNNVIARADRDKNFRETLLKGFNYGITDDEWTRFKNSTRNNRFRISSKNNAPGGIQDTSWFKAYQEQKPDDEDFNKWSYQNMVIESGLGVLKNKINIAEAQIQKELGGRDLEQDIKERAKNIKGIILPDGTTVSSAEMASAITGDQGGKVKLIMGQQSNPSLGQGAVNSNVVIGYEINGKTYNNSVLGFGAGGTQGFSQIDNLYRDVTGVAKKSIENLHKKRVEVYNKLGFDNEPWYFTPTDEGPLIESLKGIIGPDDKGKDLDIRVLKSDFSGGVQVSIPGVKKGGDKYLAEIRNQGLGTSAEITADGIVTIKGTKYNLIPQAIQNPILAQAAYQLSSIGGTSSFQQTQPGAKVPDSDIEVPVVIAGKQEKLTIQTFKGDSGPEFRVFIDTPTGIREPFTPSSNAYELFEKIGQSPVEFKKPLR